MCYQILTFSALFTFFHTYILNLKYVGKMSISP